jgi:hypothetical protein
MFEKLYVEVVIYLMFQLLFDILCHPLPPSGEHIVRVHENEGM